MLLAMTFSDLGKTMIPGYREIIPERKLENNKRRRK